jgi:hypothetical protein
MNSERRFALLGFMVGISLPLGIMAGATGYTWQAVLLGCNAIFGAVFAWAASR